MIIDKKELSNLDAKYRLKLINSISGYKAVHLIASQSKSGITNIGIFNSIVHISSNPAHIGFIMRPLTVERNTYNNIIESGFYTINHVHKSFLKQAHFTSAKFSKEESEFKFCNLKEEYAENFMAPFVKESTIKIGLKLIEDIIIEVNGTHLIIGEVQLIHIDNNYIEPDGQIDLEKAHNVCVTGLNQYSSVKKFINYPYARKEALPNFYTKKRPDNVSFDKTTQTYNASLLPYGTNIGAPSIQTAGVSTWKNSNINSFNHTFNDKLDQVKQAYQKLLDEFNINELIYNSTMGFEPIIGQIYHLYAKDNINEQFLSLIPPESWNKPYLGAYKLNSDKVWKKVSPKKQSHE